MGGFKNLSDVKTPHLDELSDQGVFFTDAYITAPQCSPSRAGLLTGRYQQRFGFDTIPDCPLPLNQSTIADCMKIAGYVTGMAGKLKRFAFKASPVKRPAGKLPLLIALHGGGGKTISLDRQLARSAEVKERSQR